MAMHSFCGVSSILFLAVSATLGHAGVRVVAPSGAPYSVVQTAVDAAVDGDTILIKAGGYAGFTVNGKALAIVADPEGSVVIQTTVLITNIGLGKSTSLSGIKCPRGGLECRSSAGSIRLEALESTSVIQAGADDHGLEASSCADLAVFRCNLTGGVGTLFLFPSGEGMRVLNSKVALYDSILQGGIGRAGQFVGMGGSSHPPQQGGAGAQLQGTSTLFASGSTITGGKGGEGLSALCFPASLPGGPGAVGGTGLQVAASSTCYLRDSSAVGGAGGDGGTPNASCGMPGGSPGQPGPNLSGVATTLPNMKLSLRGATHLREGNSLALTFEGQPGDQVWLRVGLTPQWLLDVAAGGVQLLGLGDRRALIGIMPASGVLNASIPFGNMPLGVESRTYYLQALSRQPFGGRLLGSGAVLTVLDSAF